MCWNSREIAQAWPGGLADYLAIPEECVRLGTIHEVPEGVDPVLAACSEPMSSCINAQEKGRIGPGDIVVIIGSGPVGCIHAALARAAGARRVYVAGLREERLALVRAFVHYNALTLIGTTTFAPRHQKQAVRLLASRDFPAAKLVSHRLPLSRFTEGARLALDGKALKCVFLP